MLRSMREIYNFVICLKAENIDRIGTEEETSAISARLHIDLSSFDSIFNKEVKVNGMRRRNGM